MSLLHQSPTTVLTALAARVRAARLARGWSQQELAARAGIPLPTYRVFERTGRVSSKGLVQLSGALGRLHELEALFAARPSSLDDIAPLTPSRQRGKTL